MKLKVLSILIVPTCRSACRLRLTRCRSASVKPTAIRCSRIGTLTLESTIPPGPGFKRKRPDALVPDFTAGAAPSASTDDNDETDVAGAELTIQTDRSNAMLTLASHASVSKDN